MKLQEILTEHYVNVFSPDEKMPYADRVFKLIQVAYAPIGGHVSIPDVQTLVQDTDMWKLVRRNGVIILAALYKGKNGRKFVAVGHDGSILAKKEFKKILADDIKKKRMWTEASGAAARTFVRAGVPLIPNSYAEQLTGKEILSYDGPYRYTRMIGGHTITKVLLGYPNGEHIGDDVNQIENILDILP